MNYHIDPKEIKSHRTGLSRGIKLNSFEKFILFLLLQNVAIAGKNKKNCFTCSTSHRITKISFRKSRFNKQNKDNSIILVVQFCNKTEQQFVCYKQSYIAYKIAIINNLDPNIFKRCVSISQTKARQTRENSNIVVINGITYSMPKYKANFINRKISKYIKDYKSSIWRYLKEFTYEKIDSNTIFYNHDHNNKLNLDFLNVDIEPEDLEATETEDLEATETEDLEATETEDLEATETEDPIDAELIDPFKLPNYFPNLDSLIN